VGTHYWDALCPRSGTSRSMTGCAAPRTRSVRDVRYDAERRNEVASKLHAPRQSGDRVDYTGNWREWVVYKLW
jgi:hypothetical protein